MLAAGSSSRLGEPKQLLRFGHQTLIERTIEQALFAKCAEVVVVLGANKELILPKIKHYPITATVNANWSEGMGSTLKVGLKKVLALDANARGIITMVCDQPFLNSDLLYKITQCANQTGAPIVASSYGGKIGVPAYFGAELFPRLMQLKGQQGARKVIRSYEGQVAEVAFPQGIFDVDTQEDYQKLRQFFNTQSQLLKPNTQSPTPK